MSQLPVTITWAEYKRLLERDELLSALESWGVDSWEWYDDAVDDLQASREAAEADD